MDWMVLPFQRYFEVSGRSTRREYWLFILFVMLVYGFAGTLMLVGGLVRFAGRPDLGQVDATFWFGFVLAALFALAIFIPSITVSVRRLHDSDLSGWWYLLPIVTGWVPGLNLLTALIFLVQMLRGGTAGSNRFGADPRYDGPRLR